MCPFLFLEFWSGANSPIRRTTHSSKNKRALLFRADSPPLRIAFLSYINFLQTHINTFNLFQTKYMRKNITVIAKMRDTGKVIPLSIVWEDGRLFEIERILDIRKAASTKGGGKGLRYMVRIKNQERYLWLDEHLWFIEV